MWRSYVQSFLYKVQWFMVILLETVNPDGCGTRDAREVMALVSFVCGHALEVVVVHQQVC